jgi:hypothetical protein
MLENKNPQKSILMSSIKIIIYTTVILFIAVKGASLLFHPSHSKPQPVADVIKPTPVAEKPSAVVEHDSEKDTIIKLKKELRAENTPMINPTPPSHGRHRSQKPPVPKSKVTKLKDDNSTKSKDSLPGVNKAGKEKKPNNPMQKPIAIVQNPASQLQKPIDVVQKPSDQGQKQTDAAQKNNSKPAVADETKNSSPNKSENNKSSPAKAIEFVNQRGKIAINVNISDDVKDIPVRDQPGETSEILAQFTVLAPNGYLKFIGKSKEKVEISDGKKSFWYEVKVGDKIGYIFGYNLMEK